MSEMDDERGVIGAGQPMVLVMGPAAEALLSLMAETQRLVQTPKMTTQRANLNLLRWAASEHFTEVLAQVMADGAA